MSESLAQTALVYASRYRLRLSERLGFGIHGIVFVAEGNFKPGQPGKTAIKVHDAAEPYARERQVYERLRQARVSDILGFHVPQLIRFDDELRVIEMTIVTRPFVLDFAGAYPDAPPEFSDEIWGRLGSGEARAIRCPLAQGSGGVECVGRTRHPPGGCLPQQHRLR